MAWQDRITNTGQGAVTGAGVGATIGSAVPFFGTGVGAAVGGAVGGVAGAFSSVDEQEMARQMASGHIDPVAAQALSRALHRQYDTLRRSSGQDFARRGMFGSTFAARAQGGIADSERMSLAQALASHQMARQRLGAQIQAAQQYSTSQTASNALQALELVGLGKVSTTPKSRNPDGTPITPKKVSTGATSNPGLTMANPRVGSGIATPGSGGNISRINTGGHNNMGGGWNWQKPNNNPFL